MKKTGIVKKLFAWMLIGMLLASNVQYVGAAEDFHSRTETVEVGVSSDLEEISEEISEDTSVEISEEISEDISEEFSEEASEETSEGTSEETSEESSEEATEESSEETSEESSEEATEESSEETSEESSEEATEESSEETSEEVSEEVLEEQETNETGSINWTFDFETGELSIYGQYTGEEDASPDWSGLGDKIKTAKVSAKGMSSMAGWFEHCHELTAIDFTGIDTSKVTDMSSLFEGCGSLETLDLSDFNTSRVTNMDFMFYGTDKLTDLDLENFNTSKVESMLEMFGNSGICSVNVTSFNTSNVTNMSGMFSNCESLQNLDVSKFDTRKVENISYMFFDCFLLRDLDVSGFEIGNVKSAAAMFNNCSSLKKLDVSNFDTSKMQYMQYMFSGCSALQTLDVSKFDTSNVVMAVGMFSGCNSLKIIDLSSFNLANAEIDYFMPDTDSLIYIKTPPNFTGQVSLPDLYTMDGVKYDKIPVGEPSMELRKPFTVTFDDCVSEPIEVVTLALLPVDFPETPSNGKKTFDGWYTERDGEGDKLTEDTPITENLTVYANWLPDLWVEEVEDYSYTGKAIKPEVVVYHGEVRLTKGKDYTVSYKNNVAAGSADDTKKAPTIIVKGKGNYSGTEKVTFNINKVSMEYIPIEDIQSIANGKKQLPVPNISYMDKKLKNKKDFTLEYPELDVPESYKPYKAVGSYNIIVKGKGNFTGSKMISFTIKEGISISKVKIAKIPDQQWQGTEIQPAPVVTYKDETLVAGTDYFVKYSYNIKIGKATATIVGQGKYVGKKSVTFNIVGISLAKATVTGIEDRVYSGTEQLQNVTVTLNGTVLDSEHYEVTYSKNTDAGTATVMISGSNGYTGTIKKTFKIKPYDIDADAQALITNLQPYSTYIYTKGGTKPYMVPYFAGRRMEEGSDFTCAYVNNKKLADENSSKVPTVKLKGKGNYKGTIEVPFYIMANNIGQSGTVTMRVPDMPYSPKAGKYISKPVLWEGGIKLAAGTDYEKTVVYTANNKVLDPKKDAPSVGTYITATITGKGGYTGTYSVVYKITKASFASAKIKIKTKEYTGDYVYLSKRDITVKAGSKELVYGVDYEIDTLSYENNLQKGTAKVIIKGLGNYGGQKTVKFKIAAKKMLWFWRKKE